MTHETRPQRLNRSDGMERRNRERFNAKVCECIDDAVSTVDTIIGELHHCNVQASSDVIARTIHYWDDVKSGLLWFRQRFPVTSTIVTMELQSNDYTDSNRPGDTTVQP